MTNETKHIPECEEGCTGYLWDGEAECGCHCHQQTTSEQHQTKHTPGPWERGGPNGLAIYGAEDAGYADGRKIRVQLAKVNPTGQLPPDVDVSIARLIATSPELLEACQNLVKANYGHDIPNALRDAEAAIAKATGVTK